jgi:hypothetical protein
MIVVATGAALASSGSPAELGSLPVRYLKFLDYDAAKAARRIVDYWSVRAELFGPRAFLPLLLTGRGALSAEDLEVFRTGSLMLLPRTSAGAPVLLYDPARLTTVAVTDKDKRMRCLFYWLSAVSETDGTLVSLSVYNSRTRMATFDPRLLSESVSHFGVRQVIPVRFAEAHMVMIATGLGSVIPLTVREMERMGPDNPCKVVVYDQKPAEKIPAEMKEHGFTLEGLPRVPFGGLFCFGEFRRWMDDRVRREVLVYGDFSKPPPLESPEEAEARRKRHLEAANARRKRARKKIEASVLESEVKRLRRQRDALRRTEEELTKRLEDARLVVRVFGPHCPELGGSGAAAGGGPPAPDPSRLAFLGDAELPLAISHGDCSASSPRESPSAGAGGASATAATETTSLAGATSATESSGQSQAAHNLLSALLCSAQLAVAAGLSPAPLSLLPPQGPSAPARVGGPGHPSQPPEPAAAPAAPVPPANPQPAVPAAPVPPPGAAAAATTVQLALLQELFTLLSGTTRQE